MTLVSENIRYIPYIFRN